MPIWTKWDTGQKVGDFRLPTQMQKATGNRIDICQDMLAAGWGCEVVFHNFAKKVQEAWWEHLRARNDNLMIYLSMNGCESTLDLIWIHRNRHKSSEIDCNPVLCFSFGPWRRKLTSWRRCPSLRAPARASSSLSSFLSLAIWLSHVVSLSLKPASIIFYHLMWYEMVEDDRTW